MICEPAEVSVESDGRDELPLGLMVEAGINIGEDPLAFSDGDGSIVLRRASDVLNDLLSHGRCDRPVPQSRERPRRPDAPLAQDLRAPKF
ncbi:hypothetical protein ACWEGQ_05100 [Streptomyces seoulensis]